MFLFGFLECFVLFCFFNCCVLLLPDMSEISSELRERGWGQGQHFSFTLDSGSLNRKPQKNSWWHLSSSPPWHLHHLGCETGRRGSLPRRGFHCWKRLWIPLLVWKQKPALLLGRNAGFSSRFAVPLFPISENPTPSISDGLDTTGIQLYSPCHLFPKQRQWHCLLHCFLCCINTFPSWARAYLCPGPGQCSWGLALCSIPALTLKSPGAPALIYNHFPGHSVSMFANILVTIFFPKIKSNLPLGQLEAVSSCQ